MQVKLVETQFNRKYWMTHRNDVLLEAKVIALFYTYDENERDGMKGTLHKWGDHAIVQVAYEDFINTTRHLDGKLGEPFLFKAVLDTDTELSEDELNKIINNSGYIGIWHEKNHKVVSEVDESMGRV